MDASRLRAVPLFEGLDDDELVRCAAQFEEVQILAGGGMIREGDFSYRFFVVLDGEVDVLQDFERIATLGPGDYFGEMGIVERERRNARVVAKERCTVAQLMTWDSLKLKSNRSVHGDDRGASEHRRARRTNDRRTDRGTRELNRR